MIDPFLEAANRTPAVKDDPFMVAAKESDPFLSAARQSMPEGSAMTPERAARVQAFKGTPTAPGMAASVADLPDETKGIKELAEVGAGTFEGAVGVLTRITNTPPQAVMTAILTAYGELTGVKDPAQLAQEVSAEGPFQTYEPNSEVGGLVTSGFDKPFELADKLATSVMDKLGVSKENQAKFKNAVMANLVALPLTKSAMKGRYQPGPIAADHPALTENRKVPRGTEEAAKAKAEGIKKAKEWTPDITEEHGAQAWVDNADRAREKARAAMNPEVVKILEDHNMRVEGEAERFAVFTDPVTKSTLYIEQEGLTPDKLMDKVNESRGKFERAKQEPKPKPTTAEELMDQAITSDPARGKTKGFKTKSLDELEKQHDKNNSVLERLNNPPEDFQISEAVDAWKKASDALKNETNEDARVDLKAIISKASEILEGEGLVTAERSGNYIDTLNVDPSIKGKGIGRLKVQQIEADIKRNGHSSSFVLATPESVKFWEKMGYEKKSSSADGNMLMEKSLADHAAKVEENASKVTPPVDAEIPPTQEQSLTSKVMEKTKKTWQGVKDTFGLDVLKRVSRASEKVADVAAQVAGAFGHAGSAIVDDLIGKVMPGSYDRVPNYIMEKYHKGGLAALSPKEHALWYQSIRQNEFGSILVKDRLINIWRQSLKMAKEATENSRVFKQKLAELEDQHRRLTAGKPGAQDASLLPDLEQKIASLKEGIAKAATDEKYFNEKAGNVMAAHDLNSYANDVREGMKKFKEELAAWNEHVGGYLDKLYHEGKSLEPNIDESQNTGYFTGARVNLIHNDLIDPGAEFHAVKNKADASGKVRAKDTGAGVKKDLWDREAKGTGTYTTSLYGMLRPVVSSRWLNVSKLRLFDVLQKEGLGVLTDIDAAAPKEIGGKSARLIGNIPVPVTDNLTGKTSTGSKLLYVREDIHPEIKHLLQPAKLQEIPGLRGLTTLQLAQLATDSITHATNQLTLVNKFWGDKASRIINKVPLASPVEAATRFHKYAKDVMADTPEIRSRIRELAEKGLLRDGYHTAKVVEWIANKTGNPDIMNLSTGHTLLKFDTAVRLMLYDHFKDMIKSGKFVDSETNLRNFVNQIGNYNGRLMEPWMAQVRRTTGPFLVAGMNFNRNAFRYLTGHPGAKTVDMTTNLQLRGEHLIKPMLFSVALPAIINTVTSGSPAGRPGTPPGHVDLGGEPDANGNHPTWNMAPFTPFNRAMRVTGAEALWYGLQQGKSADQIVQNAALTAARSWKHPAFGPGIEGASVLVTGHDTDFTGRQHKRKTVGAWAGIKESVRAALEKTSPQLHVALTGESEHPGAIERKARDSDAGTKELTMQEGATAPFVWQMPGAVRRGAAVADAVIGALGRALGIEKSRVARTAAEQMMVDLSFHPDTAADEGTVQYKRIKKEAKMKLRKNEKDGIAYLQERFNKGEITEDQANNIYGEAYDSDGLRVTDLQTNFKRFGVGETATKELSYSALRIYSEMSEKEKEQVHEILIDKMERAWDKAADPDFSPSPKQQKLLQEWSKYIPEVQIGKAQ